MLVFFHLGADAVSEVEVSPQGLKVFLEHPRINPFELGIASQELTAMAEKPERVEERFLDLLVTNRRG